MDSKRFAQILSLSNEEMKIPFSDWCNWGGLYGLIPVLSLARFTACMPLIFMRVQKSFSIKMHSLRKLACHRLFPVSSEGQALHRLALAQQQQRFNSTGGDESNNQGKIKADDLSESKATYER